MRTPFPGGRRFSSSLITALSLLVLSGCARDATYLSGEAQGTTWHVTIADAADAKTLRPLLERRLREIDAALSNYRADSELQRFNATPAGEWINLGTDLYHVLQTSEQISRLSDGAFDITAAPLIDLWGFGPRGRSDRLPDAAAIAAARSQVGFRYLELDPAAPRARKLRPLRIDVNGIAQGYTVDALAQVLLRAGCRNFLVEVGGELRLMGVNPRGRPWRIAIEKPVDGVGEVQQALAGTGVGITTAGDYHDYFESGGKRYSHTIDPATGAPVTHRLASVTVVADNAENADGFDTALEVLGPERGLQWAEQLGLAAYFIIRTEHGFEVRHTRAFAPYLTH